MTTNDRCGELTARFCANRRRPAAAPGCSLASFVAVVATALFGGSCSTESKGPGSGSDAAAATSTGAGETGSGEGTGSTVAPSETGDTAHTGVETDTGSEEASATGTADESSSSDTGASESDSATGEPDSSVPEVELTSWLKVFDKDQLYAMALTADGESIVVGGVTPRQDQVDGVILRFDDEGESISQVLVPGTSAVTSIATNTSGDLIVSARGMDDYDGQALVSARTVDGDVIWNAWQALGENDLYLVDSIAVNAQDETWFLGLVLSGSDPTNFSHQAGKLTSDGEPVVMVHQPGFGFTIAAAPSGGAYLSVELLDSDTFESSFLIQHVSSDGDFVWEHELQGLARGIAVVEDGLLVTESHPYGAWSALNKISPEGALDWRAETFEFNALDRVALLADGARVVCGTFGEPDDIERVRVGFFAAGGTLEAIHTFDHVVEPQTEDPIVFCSGLEVGADQRIFATGTLVERDESDERVFTHWLRGFERAARHR
ncbi:MAG: hypothetical protein B7733_00020 [Myxococcales bacterium FL481]|nr:MAG: hypothetical protein B7733_00020 [Myxococcales bacterium FL481]